MALRLIEYTPPDGFDLAQDDGQPFTIVRRWQLQTTDGAPLERVLIDADQTEPFVEWLHQHVHPTEEQPILLLSIDAVVPRPEQPDEEDAPGNGVNEENDHTGRISREELYQDVEDSIRVTGVYYALVVLSTIVAAGGMLRDSVAVVIGAMVIAPLIGPNIALALGTTLGDTRLLRHALRVNVSGLALALALSIGVGLVFDVNLSSEEIVSRVTVSIGDMLLALAAGVAGALSVTRGISTALIGVMVAVALLPPLVAVGLFVGSGYWAAAFGASLLLLTNVVSVNLAGVCTFLVQGIRPMSWYEAARAKRATRLALGLWAVALAVLIATILLAPGIELPTP